jgi:hypothetical protein
MSRKNQMIETDAQLVAGPQILLLNWQCRVKGAVDKMSNKKKDVSSRKASHVSPDIKNQKTTSKMEPLNGYLEPQMVRCGKAHCKCIKGELHGPYYLRR